ncbi:unnamed protein product [Ectocarpus sp. 12 AP-2014]
MRRVGAPHPPIPLVSIVSCDDDMLSASDVRSRARTMLASAMRHTKILKKNRDTKKLNKNTDKRSGTANHLSFFFVSRTRELIPLFLFCTNKETFFFEPHQQPT